MSITLQIKKGLDLNIAGAPAGYPTDAPYIEPKEIALTPDDFHGLTLKPIVKEGGAVKAGEPVMIDKRHPEITLTSPICGTVKAIERGERRKLLRIVIAPDGRDEKVALPSPMDNDNESVKALILSSGLWAMLRQRPYDIVPDPSVTPRDIYISALDTAPLAGGSMSVYASKDAELKKGVAALAKLTSGAVHIARSADSALKDVEGATMIDVEGPHPAGNAGVIIANTRPVNKGETVWTLDIATLYRIGCLMEGKIDYNTVVAITGSEVSSPGYVTTKAGADIASLLAGRIAESDHHVRIISGNVLTGESVDLSGYLRAPYRQITVIPEGDDVTEFMGWASLSPKKMSVSRTFPGHFLKKAFSPDARLLGGRRAMIMSGEYDKVVPMDIMTEYLVKAILSRNIEQMEALGIYEVAPEDVAVAEYVCTSKMPLQSIVREGLDYLRKELE